MKHIIQLLYLYLIFRSNNLFAASSENKGLPQLDLSTWPTQIFWLIISFASFYCIIRFFITPKIKNVINNRDQRISSDVDRAKEANKETQNIQLKYEEALREAKTQASQKAKEAIDIAKLEIEKSESEISTKIDQKIKISEDNLSDEKDKIMNNLDGIITETTISTIKKVANLDFSKNEAKKIINKIINST